MQLKGITTNRGGQGTTTTENDDVWVEPWRGGDDDDTRQVELVYQSKWCGCLGSVMSGWWRRRRGETTRDNGVEFEDSSDRVELEET
ncbi:unnamed protein product [Malus baccata var. baccata]